MTQQLLKAFRKDPMNIPNVLREEFQKRETKVYLCDRAIYVLFAFAVLAGIFALPYSLWLLLFRDGSFSRVVGALIMCGGCLYAIRFIELCKRGIR